MSFSQLVLKNLNLRCASLLPKGGRKGKKKRRGAKDRTPKRREKEVLVSSSKPLVPSTSPKLHKLKSFSNPNRLIETITDSFRHHHQLCERLKHHKKLKQTTFHNHFSITRQTRIIIITNTPSNPPKHLPKSSIPNPHVLLPSSPS
jgi:hypothetical protein